MEKLYFCKLLVAETDRKTADYQDVRDRPRHDTLRDNRLKPPNRGLVACQVNSFLFGQSHQFLIHLIVDDGESVVTLLID